MARHGRTITRKRWAGDVLIFTAPSSGTIAGQTLYTVGDQEDAPTVLRLRGSLLFTMVGPTTGDDIVVGVGVRVAQKGQVISAGIGPITEPEGDWQYWYSVPLSAIASNAEDTTRAFRLEVDSKAMRKMKPGELLQLVFQNATVGGASDAQVSGQLRWLLGT